MKEGQKYTHAIYGWFTITKIHNNTFWVKFDSQCVTELFTSDSDTVAFDALVFTHWQTEGLLT